MTVRTIGGKSFIIREDGNIGLGYSVTDLRTSVIVADFINDRDAYEFASKRGYYFVNCDKLRIE